MQMVSSNALSVALETSVTNEIPHLSIYNILNSNLKQEWARELIGKVDINYIADRTSTKIINGQESPNYKPLSITYTDANSGALIEGEVPKIDFKVEGAIETEMDYLMHENARYLSKLYPDDFNSLKTLTAAERQSYFNEALHLIHSYFDTEQIELEDEADSLYFKDKFITGITPIRGTTGTYQQEEFLLQLLNLFGIVTYSGFKTFMSENQDTLFANNIDLVRSNPSIQYTYILKELDKISKAFSEDLKAKIDSFTLKNFLSSDFTNENITLNAFLNSGAVSFKKFPVDNFTGVLNVFKDNLTGWFLEAIKVGRISNNAKLDALANIRKGEGGTGISAEDFYWNPEPDLEEEVERPSYKLLRANDQEYRNWVPVREGKFTLEAFKELEGSFCVSDLPFSQYTRQYLVKFGLSSYTEYYREALSKIIYEALEKNYAINQKLQRLIKSAANNKLVGFLVKLKGVTLAEAILSNEELLNYIRDTEEQTPLAHTKMQFIKNLVYMEDLESCTFQVKSEDTIDLEFQVYNFYTEKLPIENTYIWDWEGSTYEMARSGQEWVLAEVTEMVNKDIKVLSVGLKTGEVLMQDQTRSLLLDWEPLNQTLVIKRTVGEEEKEASFKFGLGLRENEVHLIEESGTSLCGRLVFLDEYFDRQLLDKITQKKTFTSTEDLTTVTAVASEKVAVSMDKGFDFCSLQLEVQYLIPVSDIFDYNYSWVTREYTFNNRYEFVPEPVVTVLEPNKDNFIPANTLRDRIFFRASDLKTFKLRTYPAKFLSKDSVQIEKDIVDFVKEQGQVRALLINSLGDISPVVVSESYIKNGSCYLHLIEEDSFDFFSLKDNKGYILLDIDEEVLFKDSGVLTSIRRPLIQRSCYNINDGEFYLYKENFEELKKAHLDYFLENIYAQSVDVYSKDGLLEHYGLYVPNTLTETGYVTICDLQGQSLWKKTLKSLLLENKSLYLNSCLKFIRNVPVVPQLLVWNDQYQSLSYTYSSVPPTSITFCNLDEVEKSYDSLKDVMDAVDENSGKEMNLEDLESLFSTVKMVWGNVVWDANITKSLKSLRTIWGGYLSSFELKRSNDAIPDEEILKFLNNNEVDSVTRNLDTFSYSYNKGNPDVGFNITSEVPVLKSEKSIRLPELFNEAIEINKTSLKTKLSPPVGKQYRVIETAFLTGNSLNKKTGLLEEKPLRLDVKNLEFFQLDEEGNKVEGTIYEGLPYERDYITYTPSFIDNTLRVYYSDEESQLRIFKDIKALYNKPLLAEETPLGFFQGLDLPEEDIALQFFLEYCVYLYYSYLCLGENYRDSVRFSDSTIFSIIKAEDKLSPDYQGRDYLELLMEPEEPKEFQNLNLMEVLRFARDFFNLRLHTLDSVATGFDTLPAIVRLLPATKTEGPKFEVNFYWFTEPDSVLTLKTSSFKMDAHPLVLKSLLKDYLKPSFISSPENYETFVSRLSTFSSILPNTNFTFNLNTCLDFKVSSFKEASELLGKETFKIISQGGDIVDVTESIKQNLSEVTNTDFSSTLGLRILQSIEPLTKPDELRNLLMEYKDTDKVVRNLDETFDLIPNYKIFKEYIPTTINLTTGEPESRNSDTLRCFLNFDSDLPVDTGYLLLRDLKIPNRRTSYSPSREIQLVDRSYKLEDLQTLSFKKVGDLTYQFLVSSQLKGSLATTLENLRPLDSNVQTQGIVSQDLTFGTLYAEDQPANVSYTFYKRKFITNVVIESDGRTLSLVDKNLKSDDNFSLLDHLSVGDKINLKLLETSKGKSLMGEATFNTPGGEENFVDSNYKLIAISTEVEGGSVVQKIILSCANPELERGSIVYAVVDLDKRTIEVKKAYSYKGTLPAYEAGGFIYSTIDGLSKCLASTKDIYKGTLENLEVKSFEPFLPSEVPEFKSQNLQPTITHTVEPHKEWFGYFTDGDLKKPILDEEERQEILEYHKNLGLEGTPVFDTDLVSLPIPGKVLDSIPLENREGSLVFDNLDRALFMPEDLESFSYWIDHPGLIQDYKSLLKDKAETINLETISLSALKSFLKESLTISLKELLINPEKTLEDGEEPLFALKPEFKETYFIKYLLPENKLKEGTFTLGDLMCPSFKRKEVPVLLTETYEGDNLTKFRSVSILEGHTDEKLFEGGLTLETLKELAQILTPTWYLNKKVPNTSNWSTSSDYSALWDQSNGCLIILNSLGEITRKLFLPEVGYFKPILEDAGLQNSVKQSPLYFKMDKEDILDIQNTFYKVGDSVGLYDWLKSISLNYIQSLDGSLTSETWSDYVDWMAQVDFYSDIPLISLRNPDTKYPWKKMFETWEGISGLKQNIYFIKNFLKDTLPESFVPKGSNYFRFDEVETWEGYASINFKQGDVLDSVQAFQSLLKSSSLQIDNSTVRLLGVIEYPKLEELKETLKPLLISKFLNGGKELEENEEIERVWTYIEMSLRSSFTSLLNKDYEPGTYSFKLDYDISNGTYKITASELEYTSALGKTNIGLITQNKEKLITEYGYLDSSKALQNDNLVSSSLSKIQLRVFEGLKQASSLNGGALLLSGGQIQISLQPILYSDMPEVSGTLMTVNKDSAILRAPAFITDGATSLKAIAFVSNKTKNNFQGFFGEIPYIEDLTDAQTLFEVSTVDLADFASYANKDQSGLEPVTVFDIYPEFEELDPEVQSNFYLVKSGIDRDAGVYKNSPVYLKNKFGQTVLAIKPVLGGISGGGIILRDDSVPSLASVKRDDKGYVTFEGIKDLSLNDLTYEELIGDTEDETRNNYNCQKVLALVNDPKKALSKSPMNLFTFSIAGGKIYQSPKSNLLELEVEFNNPNIESFLNGMLIENKRSDLEVTRRLELYRSLKIEELESVKGLEFNRNTYIEEHQFLDKTGLVFTKLFSKILNKTLTYPKKRPITEFVVKDSVDTNTGLITTLIDSQDINEIIFPKKGYGQALLGEYKLPNECLFEDGTFFRENSTTNVGYETVIDGIPMKVVKEPFTLVDDDFKPILDEKGNPIEALGLVYHSFADADRILKKDLSTKDSHKMTESLIDLSKFEVGKDFLATENFGGLTFLDFHEENSLMTETETLNWIYDLFLKGLNISCKAFWSKTKVDPTSKYVEEITKWSTRSKNAIPYTRIYLNNTSIPINTRYLNTKKNYVLIRTNFTPDFSSLLCDIKGNCVYLDSSGQITSNAALSASELVQGISLVSYRKVLKGLSNIFTEGYSKDNILNSGFDLGSLSLSKVNINSSYSRKDFTIVDNGKPTLYWSKDYKTLDYTYNQLTKSDWVKDAKPINLEFKVRVTSPSIRVSYKLNQNKTKYNLVYLRDKDNNLVSKIYFKEPLTEDDLLICSMVN